MSIAVKNSTVALQLSGGRLLQIEVASTSFQLSDDSHHIKLEGAFAEAMHRLVQGETTHPLLQHIETSHPWLHGLTEATPIHQTDAKLLLGVTLGILFIEVTSQCNERCIHCYADSSPERNDFLSLANIKTILDQAQTLGQPFVQFTGGDPLIHPKLVEAVTYAHALGLKNIEIYTNGLLLHSPLLAELAPYKPRFCFSIFSHDAAIHDGITHVPGSLERTLKAIRRVQELGLEARIGIALMQKNATSLADTLVFLKDQFSIPAHFIRIDPINAAGRGSDVAMAENIRIEHATAPHTPDSITNKHQRMGKLCIASNGDVHPCIFSRDIILGNIHQSSLPEILAQLDTPQKHTPSIERWQACKARLSCHDCRIIAYHLGA